MARLTFLDEVEPHAIHSLHGAGPTPEEAAQAYDALVRAAPPIGLVHLGLGPDGHTASLFPGAPALDERERLVVVAGDEAHPYPRLTFTYPALASAALVVFTVAGADKRDALAAVRRGDDLPASRVRAPRVIWLVDEAAAGDA
jgi:6-phosphogluconolactonase/glucosamine-6-phosphate isomerase/deaminase